MPCEAYEIITRAEAIERKRFRVEGVCKNGHKDPERHVINGSCYSCNLTRSRGPEAKKAKLARAAKRNAERQGRTGEHCGEPFEAHRHGPVARFCSHKCGQAAYRKANDEAIRAPEADARTPRPRSSRYCEVEGR